MKRKEVDMRVLLMLLINTKSKVFFAIFEKDFFSHRICTTNKELDPKIQGNKSTLNWSNGIKMNFGQKLHPFIFIDNVFYGKS